MSSQASSSAALPIAYVALRILIVVNWLSGVAIAALLVATPTRQWIMSSLDLTPSPEADRVILGFRAIALIGLAAIPLHYVVLKRLLAIVETVRAGDPFVAANAGRCRRSRGCCSRCSFSASSSAQSPGPCRPRHIRSTGCRLLDQRLARGTPHVPAGARVRRRRTHARRPRRDGVTWRSSSCSTTSSTTGG